MTRGFSKNREMAIVAQMGAMPGMGRMTISHFKEANESDLGASSNLHTH